MTFQGVVTNPYFKPEPSGRMLQIQSGSSMEEEEEVEQDTFSSNADFIMSITKFANAYEMELSELIQDLNKELERVSVSSDGGDGNLLLEQASVGGGDDTAVCLAYAGEVEEVVGSIFPSGQASSDEDCEVFVGADTCTVQRHGSNRSRVLEQSSHVFKEFDDYELRLQKAIHDISSLSEDLVGFDPNGSFFFVCMYCCVLLYGAGLVEQHSTGPCMLTQFGVALCVLWRKVYIVLVLMPMHYTPCRELTLSVS